MKSRIQKKVKVDWKILAIAEKEDRNKPDLIIDYKTSGFSKYGYGEIIVCGAVKNATKIMNLINTFGKMFLEGEKFSADNIHTICDKNGNIEHRFGIVYGEYPNGEKWIQLIPDFEFNSCKDAKSIEDDVEEEYVYINNRTYVMLNIDGEMKLCRLDKLVWQSFVDNTLDIFDESWELGYKDGDYKNCALENLYIVKQERGE